MTSTYAALNLTSEDDLQRQVVAHLASTLPTSCVIHHSPNEGQRKVAFKMKLKNMGTRYGWPDLEIFAPGMATLSGKPEVFFIELKFGRGNLNGNQVNVRNELIDAGFHWELCRSVDEVKDFMERVIKPRGR